MNPKPILCVGFPEGEASRILADAGAGDAVELPYDLERLLEPVEPAPELILCGEPPEEISLLEVAQVLRAQYKRASIFIVGSNSHRVRKSDLCKNGMDDAFLLPTDAQVLREVIQDRVDEASGVVRSYRAVRILDLREDVPIGFDAFVHLPLNGKYLRFAAQGDKLSHDKLHKLRRSNVATLHVPRSQIEGFYEYVARCLRPGEISAGLSETERGQRIRGAVREIFGTLFTEAATSTVEGRMVLDECRNVVSSFVSASQSGSLYDRILAVVSSQNDSYVHASNVSTYAALFSLTLGAGNTEEIAIAGMLHDLGIALLPPELQVKPPSEMTPEELKQYQRHPILTVELIKQRKVPLSQGVQTMILQHHERHDGEGYPEGIYGPRMSFEAQLLALADRFDELTAITAGKARVSPAEAFEVLATDGGHEPALVRRLRNALGAPESAAA